MKKPMKQIILPGLFLLLLLAAPGSAEEMLTPPFGYADANKDGINDLFRDADGNGIDDISGKAYPKSFQFKDGDNDGKNDLFQDRDGDGVNDLFVPGTKSRSRGIVPCMDVDQDGRNDVTGTRLSGRGFGGHGGWGRQNGFDDFVDEDGDGIDDRRLWKQGWRHRHGSNSQNQNQNQGGNNGQSDSGNDDSGNKNDDSGKKKKGK